MGRGWEKIIKFDDMGLNSALDGADIDDNECHEAVDVIFDNKVMEKAPGRVIVGTEISGAYPVDGVWRSWNKAGDKVLLRVVNGVLERWTGSAWTTVQSGLRADVSYDFINANDKTIIINGYDEALEFDPATNAIKKLGLEPPRYYKEIAYFESDEESLWTLDADHSFNTTIFLREERTGKNKQSLKALAHGAEATVSTLTYATAKDFSIYDNGISISDSDFFRISILHRTRSYVDSITFKFITSTGAPDNEFTLIIDGSELDPDYGRDNVWTDISAKKSRFVSGGTPNWNNIIAFSITLTGQTSTAEVYFDNCYWKNAPMEAVEYRKTIENFEGLLSAWTVTGGTVADNVAPAYLLEGTKSLKITRSGATTTAYKTVALNLNEFADGVLIQSSDEICIAVHVPATTNLTSVTIRFYSGANYFYYVFTVVSGAIKASASAAWNKLRKAKDLFTDSGGADWSVIDKIEIEFASTGALVLYFDQWILEEAQVSNQMATMEEADEAWSFAGFGTGDFNHDILYKVQGLDSIMMRPQSESTMTQWVYATLDLAVAKDLTEFAGGEVSGETDYISFWLYWTFFYTLNMVRLEIDCNTGDFSTDYYYHELSQIDIKELGGLTASITGYATGVQNGALRINIAKSQFSRVGVTPDKGWDTIKAYRFKVRSSSYMYWGNTGGLVVYFDDLALIRRKGLSGIYQWMCVFGSSDGTKSSPSEWSEQVLLSGTKAILSLLPISADSISERRFYRRGGTLGSTARLDFTIFDNTTLQYYTSTPDELLGETLDETDISGGTIRVPLAMKWGPKFKGEYVLYRDPENLRRVYWSLIDRIYGWSELQAYDFDSDLLDVFVEDNILFFNTKSGIRSLSISMSEATPSDFQERGIVKHSMGPFASCQIEEQRAIVSYDGVYIFNGASFQYISERVKNYFDPSVYTISKAIAFYRKKHLYISVETTGGLRSFLDCYISPESLKWRTSDYIINCFCVAEGIGDNNEIYVGDRQGNVYQFDSGYAESFELQTKDYPVDIDPFKEVVLSDIYVIAKSSSGGSGLNVGFRINQKLTSVTKLFPAGGVSLGALYKLYHAQLKGIEDYLKGYKVGLVLTPSANDVHCAVQAIKLVGEIAPLEEEYESGERFVELANGENLLITTGDSLELSG